MQRPAVVLAIGWESRWPTYATIIPGLISSGGLFQKAPQVNDTCFNLLSRSRATAPLIMTRGIDSQETLLGRLCHCVALERLVSAATGCLVSLPKHLRQGRSPSRLVILGDLIQHG